MGGIQLHEIDDAKVEQLRVKLVQPDIELPEKYRVLFSLRNVKGGAAHAALVQGGCRLRWRRSRLLSAGSVHASPHR